MHSPNPEHSFGRARVRALLDEYRSLAGRPCPIFHDPAAGRRCASRGLLAYADGHGIHLSPHLRPGSTLANRAIVHELAHMAQFHRAGPAHDARDLETEAVALEDGALTRLADIRGRADPAHALPLFWLVPVAAAAYVLLRPGVANAPGPDDPTYPSVSTGQVAAEAVALFALPAASFSIAGRLGLGWISSSAISGATATTSFRGVQDMARGEASDVTVYIYDAATGAVVAVLIGGVFVAVGRGMQGAAVSVDDLATRGLAQSEVVVTRRLSEAAAASPNGLNAQTVAQISGARPYYGRMSQWWLDRRGQVVYWRGQTTPTVEILSPVARGEGGVAASQALTARARAAGMTDGDIASTMAFLHSQPLPRGMGYPPSLVGQPVGGVGIPVSTRAGIAASFGEDGVVYLIRLPQGAAIRVPSQSNGLLLENEFMVLNRLPEGAIVDVIPASRIPPLTLDSSGRIVPGYFRQ